MILFPQNQAGLPLSRLFAIFAAAVVATAAAFGQADEEQTGEQWRYTLEKPGEGWQNAGFDDSGWQTGDGGFGTRGTPGARVGTTWNSGDIWLRKTVEIPETPTKPSLLMHHDEDAEVFVNGQQVVALSGWTQDYEVVPIEPQHHSVLKQGRNLIAVHCRQTTGGQYIDVHFFDGDDPPLLPKAKPFASDLITRWGADVTADNVWTEYPRPQMSRTEWINLNGNWDYAVTSLRQTEPPQKWDGKILVPFCLESRLGGVKQLLDASESLWYRRTFQVERTADTRTLLNFEAVDYRCEVFVNGTSVGKHQGGNTPFTFEITESLQEGDNELMVRVEDETEGWQLRGKQVLNAHGIWYTQVSGIWQTVWIERVPESYISDLTITTDAESGTIKIRPEIEGKGNVGSIRVVVNDGEKQVATAESRADEISLTIENAKLWFPTSPHLYDLTVSLLDESGTTLDQTMSYAGIRSVGKKRGADGHLRMTLNGETLFHWGPLDQGWWPDGLLTPPSDEAMLFDIEWLKSAGFNMIRKHIKVEPRRYYYHCDRLGMMVWQDQVSAGHGPPWTRLDKNPQDADWPDDQHEQFMLEFEWMIDTLESHPSIVVWVPFNEAWGQHRTMSVGEWTVQRDPTRLVNIASGGNFWPIGDIVDQHAYPHPAFPFDPQRYKDFIKVVGEFGGHGFPVQGHLWDAQRENWGYGGLPKSKQEYRNRYVKSLDILNRLKKRGIAAGVYTQTTDVEGEINGLMTYDREVIKIPAKDLSDLHQKLYSGP